MNQSLFQAQHYRRYYRNFEPLFKDQRVQAYTMLALSILTIAFFGMFAIKPTLTTIASLRRQIQDKSYVNGQLDEKINALIRAQQAYQQLEPDLPLVFTLMPETADFPPLLRRLEILAATYQTTITAAQFSPVTLFTEAPTQNLDFKPQNVEADSTPVEPSVPEAETPAETPPVNLTASNPVIDMAFSITFQGEYTNLVQLLERLVQLDRLITLDSVTFSNSAGSEAPSLTIAFHAKSYYLPLPL